jgi:signal transduction histidine kinase
MDIQSFQTKIKDMARGFREPWATTPAGTGQVPVQSLRTDLFHSARLKLTAFYFAILVVFCLLLTFGVRAFTQHELNRGDDAQQRAAHQIFQQYSEQYSPNDDGGPPSGPFGDRYFARAQNTQADQTRRNLNRDFLLLDLILLAGGAIASYWYAGRTLKPIEEVHEQQKRFTSDASHELRTPLASMKLENEVFLRQKDFSETEARELIASNLEEVDRLEKLATNLLSLSSYEHGDMSHAPVVVGELVQAAIEHVTRAKSARKINFTQDIVGATVDVNRESMVELLTILLDNAVKYGPKDGKVDIGGFMQDEAYVLTVRDHGPGIADADLPHIFERMYRGDKARSSKVSGHGIGLSLAKQIAEANDAELTAANAPNGGAVFTLTLQ